METKNGPPVNVDLATFLTLPHEELIVIKRTHWFTFVLPLFILISFSFLIYLASSTALYLFLSYFPLFLGLTFFIISLLSVFAMKLVVDWYFHFYVITTRKIVEVCYIPLSSYAINNIILDQVRCTEIDIKTKGILQEVMGIGDIIITFDRPTHQEEFWLQNIPHVKRTGALLNERLRVQNTKEQGNAFSFDTSWYNQRKSKRLSNKPMLSGQLYSA